MQLAPFFATLLASILLASNVNARPLSQPAGMVTLPIRRLEQPIGTTHPKIYLQQHINRGNKRLARMTGGQLPSDHELRARIIKRLADIEHDAAFVKRARHSGHVGLAAGKASASEEELSLNLKKARPNAATKGNGAGAAGQTNQSSSTTTTGASEGVQKANKPASADSLGLDIEGSDTGFLATIQMGTPPRDFSILMDSGSADLWVGAENCQTVQSQGAGAAGAGAAGAGAAGAGAAGAGAAGQGAKVGTGAGGNRVAAAGGNRAAAGGRGRAPAAAGNSAAAAQAAGCGNHIFLGSQSSSSFQDTGNPFQITYGTGAVAGTIVQDDILVAGLQLKGHTFGTAQQETQDFSDNSVAFDGLMGLAQSTLSEQKTLTPVEALAKQGLIQAPITSYKIPRAADNKNDGEITFGALDTTKFDQATLVNLANINQQGFWEADMDGVTVDGQDTQLQGRTAILDTGTTLIIAPPQDAQAVHALITGAQSDGQGGFVLPCAFNQTVALSFGGTVFAIDPRDMVVGGQPVAQDPQTGEDLCFSGISEGNVGGAQEWLVGDVFLKNAYFSTDVGKNTVSLAKLV